MHLQIYPAAEVQQAKLNLLSKTNMVDFAMDIHKTLHTNEEVPAEFKERREEVRHGSLHCVLEVIFFLLLSDFRKA